MNRSRSLASAALLIACAIALPSCKTLDVGKADPTALAAAKIAVQYGTMRYISTVPDDARAAKAERVRAVVTDVESLVTGEAVSLQLLAQEIRKRLPADLKPEDQLAVNSLLELVMTELRARVGDGLLDPNQVLQVKTVADWVIEATRFYSA